MDGWNQIFLHIRPRTPNWLSRLAECFLLAAGVLIFHFGRIFPRRAVVQGTQTRQTERRKNFRLAIPILSAIAVVLGLLTLLTKLYSPIRPGLEFDLRNSHALLYYVNRLFLVACIYGAVL